MGNKSISDFDREIKESEKGLVLTWKELQSLSNKFEKIFDILIIGCQNINLLSRYEEDQEMYETCDIVIEMIDGGFWQVFSKDYNLINKLSRKFKEVEFLESDFQKDFYK